MINVFRSTEKSLVFSIFLILLLVVLYDALLIYRVAAFMAVPYDDYSPYLRFLATWGEQGALVGSPYRERFGSLLLAMPFLLAPRIEFSGAMLIDPDLMRYSLALSLANAFYFYAGCAILGLHALTHLRIVTWPHAALKLMLFFVLCLMARQILSLQAIDGIGFFLVCLLVLLFISNRFFALSIAGSIFILFNEKATLVTLGLVAGVVLATRGRYYLVLPPAFVLALYVLYRMIFGAGNEAQLDFNIGQRFIEFYNLSTSPRGILLNVIPLLLIGLSALSIRNQEMRIGAIIAFILILAAAVQAAVIFNVGRIVFYCMPIVIAGLCFFQATDASDRGDGPDTGTVDGRGSHDG